MQVSWLPLFVLIGVANSLVARSNDQPVLNPGVHQAIPEPKEWLETPMPVQYPGHRRTLQADRVFEEWDNRNSIFERSGRLGRSSFSTLSLDTRADAPPPYQPPSQGQNIRPNCIGRACASIQKAAQCTGRACINGAKATWNGGKVIGNDIKHNKAISASTACLLGGAACALTGSGMAFNDWNSASSPSSATTPLLVTGGSMMLAGATGCVGIWAKHELDQCRQRAAIQNAQMSNIV